MPIQWDWPQHLVACAVSIAHARASHGVEPGVTSSSASVGASSTAAEDAQCMGLQRSRATKALSTHCTNSRLACQNVFAVQHWGRAHDVEGEGARRHRRLVCHHEGQVSLDATGA